jgi:PST family polysaccharide transporter
MNGRVNLVRRLAGFSTLPFLAAILPFVALPIVSRAIDDAQWTAVNVGLSVGAIASAVALVGWNVLGTPLVAMAATQPEREELYARSFYIRAVVAVVSSVVASAVCIWLAPASAVAVAIAFAIATTLNGIGLSWYAVGVSSPAIVVWYEVVPRGIATAIAIFVVPWTGDALWYGVLLCAAALAGTFAFHVVTLKRLVPSVPGYSALRADLLDMKAAWGVEASGNLYANAPVPIASGLSTVAGAAAFSSADKIYRYGTLGIAAAGNAFQGWVLETRRHEDRRRRNVVALVGMTAIGAAGWLFLALAGPWASALLFGAEKQGDPMAFHFYGVAFFAVSVSTPLIRNILIPARRDRAVLAVTLVAAALGIGLMVIFGISFGVAGVAAGFAVSEAVTMLACGLLAVRAGIDVAHHRTAGSVPQQLPDDEDTHA